jgi:hypothetical protein
MEGEMKASNQPEPGRLLNINGNLLTPSTLREKALNRRAALLAGAGGGATRPSLVRAAKQFILDVEAGRGGAK